MSSTSTATDGAGGEERNALCRKQVQDVGEIDVEGRLARLERAAVGSGHECVSLGVVAEEGVADDGEVEGRGCADPVALAAGPGGGLDEAPPRHQSETVPGHRECLHGTGVRDRAVSRADRHPAAVVGGDLAHAVAERRRVEAAAGHLDVAVDDDRVGAGEPHVDEGAAHEADDAGLGAHGGQGRGDRRVDGVPALGGHLEPGLQGRRTRGGERDPGHEVALPLEWYSGFGTKPSARRHAVGEVEHPDDLDELDHLVVVEPDGAQRLEVGAR